MSDEDTAVDRTDDPDGKQEVEGEQVPEAADDPVAVVEDHEAERKREHEQSVHDSIEKSKVRGTEAEEIVNPDDAPNEANERS